MKKWADFWSAASKADGGDWRAAVILQTLWCQWLDQLHQHAILHTSAVIINCAYRSEQLGRSPSLWKILCVHMWIPSATTVYSAHITPAEGVQRWFIYCRRTWHLVWQVAEITTKTSGQASANNCWMACRLSMSTPNAFPISHSWVLQYQCPCCIEIYRVHLHIFSRSHAGVSLIFKRDGKEHECRVAGTFPVSRKHIKRQDKHDQVSQSSQLYNNVTNICTHHNVNECTCMVLSFNFCVNIGWVVSCRSSTRP